MVTQKISKRLEAAASFARRGARFADIGTDHAYLPIYLYSSGISSGGVATDINRGPVERGAANLRRRGLEGSIALKCTDGLCGVEEYSPEDIFILGMGGELIVSILSSCQWIEDEGIRLILQPMTHPELLRGYLFERGFAIVEECLVEDEKIYQIICAEYVGQSTQADDFELLFGIKNAERGGELFCKYLRRMREVFDARACGKRLAMGDTRYEDNMIKTIDLRLLQQQARAKPEKGDEKDDRS